MSFFNTISECGIQAKIIEKDYHNFKNKNETLLNGFLWNI